MYLKAHEAQIIEKASLSNLSCSSFYILCLVIQLEELPHYTSTGFHRCLGLTGSQSPRRNGFLGFVVFLKIYM